MAGGPPFGVASNAPNSTTDERAIGRACDVLASQRRRAVIDFLRTEAGDSVSVETLAEHVAAVGRQEQVAPPTTNRTDDPPATDLSATDPSEPPLRAELSHVHLPKLADAGVVSYAPDAGTVEYVGDETVEALLDAADETVAELWDPAE